MKADDLLLHLEAYIALESALGFSLRTRERLLRNFVAFVQGSGTMGPITAQIALDWACLASEPLRDQWKSGAPEHRAALSVSPQCCRPGHRNTKCDTPSPTTATKAVSVFRRGDKPAKP
jgi:hypothetical protein